MPIAAVGGVGDAVGPEQWFRSLPIVTQYWFGAVVTVTLAANFGVVSPSQLVWSWAEIVQKVQLWRVATCFLYMGPFSINTVLSCYMLVSFSQRYESGGPFNTGAGGGTADYAFCLLVAMGAVLVSYPVLGPAFGLPPVFAGNLVYFVLYLWSKRNPTANANIWGVPMPGSVLPFAYLGLTVVMGHPYFPLIHGYLIAHIYYFLADVVPQVQGRDVLATPQFLIDRFGIGEYRPDEIRVARAPDPRNPPPAQGQRQGGAAAAAGRAGGGYNWGGTGRALGRE
jgi:Derlin-2/3